MRPHATVIDTWTDRRISLGRFVNQDVDLTDVENMTIGVGTQSDTATAGGGGLLFFDDIRLYRP